ncbi:MAG: FGGY family carbohydrate kinase [Bacteroidota bacterium]
MTNPIKARLIFDIGKTNKKCFLFDDNYQQLYRDYRKFAQLEDEDGYPCDDLAAITEWVFSTLDTLLAHPDYDIHSVNFSTYGATLVHLDAAGEVLGPIYNYTKSFPPELLVELAATHGDLNRIARATASPTSGMLNVGFQLYWLKRRRPERFAQIAYSLHLPQYFSYLLTGVAVSDFTSLGCHTSLWDYQKEDYHQWVDAEGLTSKLAPLVDPTSSLNLVYRGHRLQIGVGIHDSSAALLPYLRADRHPFLLVSTGTWAIALNPFNDALLTAEELAQDCLNYLRIDGQPVRAARLFLGKEYTEQVAALTDYYGVDKALHKSVQFDQASLDRLAQEPLHFAWIHLKAGSGAPLKTNYQGLDNFVDAYHQLMKELVELQVAKMRLAIGDNPIRKIYIDGGFADNPIYVHLLALAFPAQKIRTTQAPLGSALGAALVISDDEIGRKFLKRNYAMKKYKAQFV